MDTEKQRQHRHDDARLTKSGDARLLMVPTEMLLTNREWLPGELLSGSEHRTPGWFLDMNIRLVCGGIQGPEYLPIDTCNCGWYLSQSKVGVVTMLKHCCSIACTCPIVRAN